jgi:hypothetical protein
VVDVGASSSSIPGNGARKELDVRSVSYQLGTPRGRYDEHNNKFSLSKKPSFNRPVGEQNNFRRLLLANFGNDSRELVYGACLGRSFGASSNVEPTHNTTKVLCPSDTSILHHYFVS